MSYRASNGKRQWDGSKNFPEERMAMKMEGFAKTGITPDIAGADLSYALKLQHNRWKEKGLQSTIEVVPADVPKMKLPDWASKWNDGKYSYERRYDYGTKKQKFYKNGKCLYTREKEVGINAMVTNMAVANIAVENDYYCCPSCGANSKIKELMEGCPYCQNKFMMTDLFPKVTNFYMFENDTNDMTIPKVGAVLGAIALCIYQVILGNITLNPMAIIMILVSILGGGFAGYIASLPIFLVYAICKGIKGTAEVGGSKSAEKQIERKMKQVDPNFSYKIFEGQLVSYLQMVLFSNDISNLSCFEGGSVPEKYKDLIDISYHGTVSLKQIETPGDLIRLNMTIFARNTYFINDKIKVKDEQIPVQVTKKVYVPSKIGFSVRTVTCKQCGGSFDASRQKKCSFCQSPYDMKLENWVITRIG